jgi:hypothetical protein
MEDGLVASTPAAPLLVRLALLSSTLVIGPRTNEIV